MLFGSKKLQGSKNVNEDLNSQLAVAVNDMEQYCYIISKNNIIIHKIISGLSPCHIR